ncbi:zinc finger BED domain-containing protein 1 [Elysia marginata]|uniref:Zinc finger BED domain-containing protein 1 n=1 Tax=Elysia marginata TaxID=1093978 RepID=A0AAV4FU79_9GAST|nr:zinc finger BED domain-containing protein 1 [Elysia marginata]
MRRHLNFKHKIEFAAKEEELKRERSTPKVTETNTEQGPPTPTSSTPKLVDQKIKDVFERKSKYNKDSPRQKALDEMLAEMICFDMQPFSIVEERGFRTFIQALDPRYEIPGRKKITQVIIPRLYKREEEAVKKELENTEHVALTTDEWTSRTTKGYMAVTAHFINNNMTLQSRVLETRRITSSVTLENIKDELNHVMDSWGIQEKVFAIVTDNAANMKSAINLLKKDMCLSLRTR